MDGSGDMTLGASCVSLDAGMLRKGGCDNGEEIYLYMFECLLRGKSGTKGRTINLL